MLLWGLVIALVLTAATQAQYRYAKSRHLLSGPLAVDETSQWLTKHLMWLVTLFFGSVGGCFLYFLFWVILILSGRNNSNMFKRKGRTKL